MLRADPGLMKKAIGSAPVGKNTGFVPPKKKVATKPAPRLGGGMRTFGR